MCLGRWTESSGGREDVSVLARDHSNENSSYVPVRSEKRDVVGTGRASSNGKIMTLAVIAEYRSRGISTIAVFDARTPG